MSIITNNYSFSVPGVPEAEWLCWKREERGERFSFNRLFIDNPNVYLRIPRARLAEAKIVIDCPLEIPAAEIDAEKGILVARLLVLAGLCKSNSDGRRLIQGGAVALDDQKVTDASAAIDKAAVAAGPVLRAGKKNMRRLKLC